MTTLITGATGRVGRELVTVRKARGDRIRALVLPGDPGLAALKVNDVEVVEGSLTDRGAVSEAVTGVNRVAHLAAAMLWEPSADRELFEQNISGTFHLLDEIVQQGCKLERFFLASSDEVYPSLKASYLPIDEPHPLNPYSFYGLTKETNERFSFYYHRAHDIPATVARFALIARSEEILRPDGWSGRFMFVAPCVICSPRSIVRIALLQSTLRAKRNLRRLSFLHSMKMASRMNFTCATSRMSWPELT